MAPQDMRYGTLFRVQSTYSDEHNFKKSLKQLQKNSQRTTNNSCTLWY